MSTLVIGILGFIALTFAALKTGSFEIYLNSHALWVVFGGTLMTLLLLTPASALKRLVENLLELFQPDVNVGSDRETIMQLAQNKTENVQTKNPLITYAATLWARGVNQDVFIALISEYKSQLENKDVESILALRSLGKYPSALGMLGTVTGIVSLFSNLTVDGKGSIGPSLAVAMTSTFYGLLVAHLVVMPLSDRLVIRLARKKQYFTSTYEILILIERNEPAVFIETEMVMREAA